MGRGEFDLIAWAKGRAGPARGRVRLGIGDDCAALSWEAPSDLLVTTDMLMDGRHFVLSEHGPEAVGYKALGVNLSDVAAMGGTPLAAFVAVALPRGAAWSIGQGLLTGMAPLAERFGVALAGGDTNAWEGPLVVSVTLVGEAPPGACLTRSGARVGDFIYVTGPLGGSLSGRHLRPWPRIDEGRALAESPVRPTAMIDLSDGLSSDLRHVLDASGNLGAIVWGEEVPVHKDARAIEGGRSPLERALHDGEDFELCFTIAPGATPCVPAVRVGVVTEGPERWLEDAHGGRSPLRPRGFDHLA